MAVAIKKKSQPFGAAEAWNAVSPEERLDLISQAHAEGVSAAFAFAMLMSSIAYGFDKIWLLWFAAAGALLVMPLFASYAWRRGKPTLILQYLAARSVARRYAFGAKVPDLDLVLIFRGEYKELFENAEEEFKAQRGNVDFNASNREFVPVWIALMRGGIVIMSERLGGARLEFISNISSNLEFREAELAEDPDEDGWIIVGTGLSVGRKVLLKSKHKASLYVFSKRVEQLLVEVREVQQKLDALRRAAALNEPVAAGEFSLGGPVSQAGTGSVSGALF